MKTCSTNECFEDRETGDNTFCFNCRTEWVCICNQYFGVEMQATESEVLELLTTFQNRLANQMEVN